MIQTEKLTPKKPTNIVTKQNIYIYIYCNKISYKKKYGHIHIPVNERHYESVEDEYYVLMRCPKYDDIRTVAFESICGFTNILNKNRFI